MPKNFQPAARRFAFVVLVPLLLFVVSFFAFIGTAHAAEGVTRTIGGVNYTLPSDWTEIDVPIDAQQAEQVADAVAFTKYDAFFFALHIPSSPGDYVSLAEFEEFAQQAAHELGNTPLDSVIVSAQMEQGCPALTLYTNDIAFNDVVYALTLKLFAVDTGVTSDAVLMCSFLPADGVLHEDVFAEMPYSDVPQAFQLADVMYELPGGYSLAWGNVFDFEFVVARGESGAVLGFEIPMLADDGTVYAADLNEIAVQMQQELQAQFEAQGLGDLVRALWIGGYDFVGFPTLGLEFMLDAGDGFVAYICSTANITPGGTAFMAIAQQSDSDLAAYVLGNAVAVEASDPGYISGFTDEEAVGDEADSQAVDLGFVIGAIG